MTTHISPDLRTAALLDIALGLAAADGWRALTRDAIARAAGVSTGLVSARLGTMDSLRRSVMRLAVQRRVVSVVAEGLVSRHPAALKADAGLRELAVAWVVAA